MELYDVLYWVYAVCLGHNFLLVDLQTLLLYFSGKSKKINWSFYMLFFFVFSSPDPKSEINPINQQMKTFWPYVQYFESLRYIRLRHKKPEFIHPYKPRVLFVGHRQTVQTQIRCCRMCHMIRFSNVCLQNIVY